MSACCTVLDRPAAVARSLALLRPAVDEILVAVDARLDPSTLGPLVDIADLVVRFEHEPPTERVLPWLVARCSGDRVLVLDDDEVPSAAFVAAVTSLATADDIVQARVARRWCFPDARTWLAERPWWPDFRVRLARRAAFDADVWRHGGLRPRLPAQYVGEPLYQVACLVNPAGARRRLARRAEADRPGLVARGGGPFNDTLLVPEHFATRRPVAVPDEDVARLEAVLAAPASQRRPAPRLPFVAATEIDAHIRPDPLVAGGARAEVCIAELDLRTAPGNPTMLTVEVVNRGPVPLPADDVDGVQLRVATRVLDRRPGQAPTWWMHTPLLADVPPGAARLVEAHVQVPDDPGVYTVEMNLVNERGQWSTAVATFDLIVAHRWARHIV